MTERWSGLLGILERLVAAIGLLAAGPILLAAACAIRLDDGLPILFRQIRLGRHGRPFQIIKLRTMRAGSAGSAITAGGDVRVTRAGAWLRRYKLDEIPQLWNVCNGEMSFIGPRPERPEFVNMADPIWQAVLASKPGITDLATLLFRDEETILARAEDPVACYRESILPRKLDLNLRHRRVRCVRTDVKLILLTLYYSIFPARFDAHAVHRYFARFEDL